MNIDNQKLVIDISTKIGQVAWGNKGDVNSRKLEIYVLQKGIPMDLTGVDVDLYSITPLGKKICDNLTITNAKLGKALYNVPTDITSVQGVTKSVLVFRKGTTQLISFEFEIKINRSIYDENAITSDNKFGMLIDALRVTKEYEDALKDASFDLERKYTDRLNGVDAQLDHNVLDTIKIKNDLYQISDFSFEIWYPLDFPKLPFRVYKDIDNAYKHDYDINYDLIGFNIYCTGVGGQGHDVNNDGLSKESPVSSIKRALDIANARSESNIIINMMNETIDKDRGLGVHAFTLNKNVTIKHIDNKRVTFTNSDFGLIYTFENGLYKTNKTAVREVLDVKYLDKNNCPFIYEKVVSISECQSKKASFYIDTNNDVYINTIDGRTPDNNIVLNRIINPATFNIAGKKLVFYNCIFALSHSSLDSIKVTGDSNSILVNYNCVFTSGGANGLATLKVGRVYSFDCISFNNGSDGFNYHSTLTQAPTDLIFEYNCLGFNNGLNGLENNNATTGHEGINIIRVGCVGHTCRGPICADVNGCWSLLYNCVMYNSIRSTGSTKTGYWFDSSVGNRGHKAWLIDCGGDSEYSLNGDVVGQYSVKAFKGNKIPPHIKSKIQFI